MLFRSKASVCNAGDPGLIPGLGRSPGEGNGNPLQHSCLENPMDRGAWCATVHGVAKSRTRLSNFTFTFTLISTDDFYSHMTEVLTMMATNANLAIAAFLIGIPL